MLPTLLLALVAVSAPAARDDTDFIRFIRGKTTARLETACVTYEDLDSGRRVCLVSAVHIGDPAYYEEVQKRLDAFDVVLYEGVKGSAEEQQQLLTLVGRLQMLLKDYLGLAHQRDAIDYDRPNFVHADMEAAELARRLADADVELLPFSDVIESMGPMIETALRLLKPDPGGRRPALLGTIQKHLEVYLAELLGNGLGIYEHIKREEDRRRDAIIIGARNGLVSRKLDEVLADPSVRTVAIYYGAAHDADLERRLTGRLGLRMTKVEWLPAWTIRGLKPDTVPVGPDAPAPKPDPAPKPKKRI